MRSLFGDVGVRSFKIGVVSDSEARPRNRSLGMLGERSPKMGVVVSDSEARPSNRAYILTIYFFQGKISKQSQC